MRAAELFEAGADIHTRVAREVTPLHFAAYKGALDAVERLLGKAANTSAIDGVFGLTPVEIAIRTRQWYSFDRLVAAGPLPRADSAVFQAQLEAEG